MNIFKPGYKSLSIATCATESFEMENPSHVGSALFPYDNKHRRVLVSQSISCKGQPHDKNAKTRRMVFWVFLPNLIPIVLLNTMQTFCKG